MKSPCEPGGRRFESCSARQKTSLSLRKDTQNSKSAFHEPTGRTCVIASNLVHQLAGSTPSGPLCVHPSSSTECTSTASITPSRYVIWTRLPSLAKRTAFTCSGVIASSRFPRAHSRHRILCGGPVEFNGAAFVESCRAHQLHNGLRKDTSENRRSRVTSLSRTMNNHAR